MEPNMDSQTESQNADVSAKRRDRLLPISILIAAVLVSGALIYNTGKQGGQDVEPTLQNQPGPDRMRPVTADDHMFGDPNAPVMVVEYSDLECPFCKRFHVTMQQAVTAYGGKVAWVYRHSPIDQLHPKARKEAEASECAAELGGNEKFWAYVDRLFALTPSNNGLDLAKLPTIAADVGLDRTAFESCLSSGKYAAKVEAHRVDAENAGGGGTPYSIVVATNGKKTVIPGALPLTSTNPGEPSVKAILDEALK